MRRALLVGLLNTLLVAVTGIVTASIIGFVVGIGRLSRNWLIRKISTVYVEIFRNIPPLLVIFFWYLGVLSVLPLPRDSYHLPFGSFLNSRGFFLPRPIWAEGSWLIGVAFLLAIAMSWFVARRARQRQMATGQQFRCSGRRSSRRPAGAGLLAAGMPLSIEFPQRSTFNAGGTISTRVLVALSGAVLLFRILHCRNRAGRHLGVSKGQPRPPPRSVEAGVLRLVVVPQALRTSAADQPVPGLAGNSSLYDDRRRLCRSRGDRGHDQPGI